MLELFAKAEEKTPFVLVALQECERMNTLTREIRRSLKEVDLGLKVSYLVDHSKKITSCTVSWNYYMELSGHVHTLPRPHTKSRLWHLMYLLLGRTNNHFWHGRPTKLLVPGQGTRVLDQESLPIPGWLDTMVCWPPPQDPWAGWLGVWLQYARLHLARWVLQPTVLPHRHYAVHGQKERVASGQDVPPVWRD